MGIVGSEALDSEALDSGTQKESKKRAGAEAVQTDPGGIKEVVWKKKHHPWTDQ